MFVREASIVGNIREKRFFTSDLCKFDVIRGELFTLIVSKITVFYCFSGKRGFEAINVHIIDRAVDKISKLPKIPKKKQAAEQNQVSGDFFRTTM